MSGSTINLPRVAAGVVLAAGLAVLGLRIWPRAPQPEQVVHVGVDQSPPFYLILPDGSVTGLAVDVLNEAARRRHIRLIWKPLHDIPVDSALEKRIVQLWPLVGTTPERQKKFFLSKPWLESYYVLLSLHSHPVRNAIEAAGKVVAHARLTFTQIVADRQLSRSKEMVLMSRTEAIQAVCHEEAAAALVESRVLDAILLTRPEGCEKASFSISALPGAAAPLSIVAVPEVKEAAAALREEIRNLTANGFLNRKMDEWSPFSSEGARSVWAEEEANRRNSVYRYVLIVILGLTFVLAWLVWRGWQLKRKAETADAAMRDAQRRFAAFMDNSPAMAFMKDSAGRLLYASKAWSSLMMQDVPESLGKNDFELWPEDIACELRSIDLQILLDERPVQAIERLPVTPFDVRDLLVIKFPFRNEKGEKFIGGTAIDITEREAAIRALAASESRYRKLFDLNPLPAWVCDRENLSFLMVNDAATRRYGWTRQEFLSGMTLPNLLAPGEGPEQVAKHQPGPWRHVTKDGLILSVDVTKYDLEYEQRRASLMIIRDLTEQERMLDELKVGEERWQLALRGAGDALWDWDLQTNRVFRSPRWRSMLGYEQAEIGDSLEEFLQRLHPDDRDATLEALHSHLESRTEGYSAEYRLRHKDGSWRWIMDRGKAVWDERGRPVRMAGSHTEITERKQAEDILSREARTDALTGLANRREFERLFDDAVRVAREDGTRLSVCVCDLDRFKLVNDSYGHAIGDKVLIAFAAVLREHVRRSDLLARIGGDEFVIAMNGASSAEAGEVMERIRELWGARVFSAASDIFNVSSSFGVAELRASHINGNDLIAEADRSLYLAKDGGRNRTLVAA